MSFSKRSYQELQFLVFEYLPSFKKINVIFFCLDITRDKMQVVFIHYFNKHLSTFQKISLLLGLCDVGYGRDVLTALQSLSSTLLHKSECQSLGYGNRKALRASGAGRVGGCFTEAVRAGLRLRGGTEMCSADKEVRHSSQRQEGAQLHPCRAGLAVGPEVCSMAEA